MRTNSVMNMVGTKTFRRTFFLLAVLLLFVPALASAQALVAGQDTSNTFDPNNPNLGAVSVTFAKTTTVNNLIVVVVGWSDTSSTVANVTDDANNAYQVAAGTNASACCSQVIYFAKVATASQTVTVNFNQVAAAPDVRIREYSGLSASQPLETSAGAPGVSGSPNATADSGPATTSNNDLIVGAGTISSFFSAGGAGFGNVRITPHYSDIIEDKTAAAGSVNATATAAAGNWAMQMVAFTATPVAVVGTPTITNIAPNSGPDTGGTATVITGTNFQSGAVVLFDGASAVNCSVKSATEIDCSTPTHGIGGANVTVQNVNSVASAASAFTYTASTPTITNVTSTAGQNTTNGGNQITITGTGFVGPAAVKMDGFNGIPASNVTVVNSTTITASAPAHQVGAADVYVRNADSGNTTAAGAYSYVLGSGPVNFIQGAGVGASSGTHSTWNASFPNPQTAGDTTIVIVGWSNSGDVSSVTDDIGNTYTRALPTSTDVAGNLSQTIYYAKNIKSSTTITVNFTTAVGAPDVRVLEYSGLDHSNPLDTSVAAAAAAFGNGTVADSGAVSTTFSNNLIVGGAMVATTVTGAGGNFVITDVSNDGNGSEHQFNSAPVGGAHAIANLSKGNWLIQAVTFHANPALAPPDFTLGASPTSSSVNPGSSATYTLSLTPQNGFNSAVNLTCSGPSGVGIACALSPSSITPGTPSTLTVSTTGPTAALVAPARSRSLLPLYAIWLPLPGMALAGIGYASRKRKLAIGMTLFMALGLALLLAGCGGGGSSSGGGGGGGGGGGTGGTAAGTYTITVTGTSGNLSHNAKVTLTVQ